MFGVGLGEGDFEARYTLVKLHTERYHIPHKKLTSSVSARMSLTSLLTNLIRLETGRWKSGPLAFASLHLALRTDLSTSSLLTYLTALSARQFRHNKT